MTKTKTTSTPDLAGVETKIIGTHQYRLEGDLVFLTQRGDFLLSDAQAMNAEVEAVLTRLGRAFIMVDQSRAGATPPETRRCIAEWNKQHKATGAVMFGGSAAARAAATLVLTAIRLFRPDSTPTVFAATEAEARAWISERRAKLTAATTAS